MNESSLIPQHPRSLYHWLRLGEQDRIWTWSRAKGLWLDNNGDWSTPLSMTYKGWKYVSPVYGPADDRFYVIRMFQQERNELRKLLADLGAGIPAAAILKAEDRT